MATREELSSSKLIELHVRQNLTLSQIGKLYGISRQRVHQIKKDVEKTYGKITRRMFIDVFSLKHYLEQGWSAKEIALHYDMKPSKVARLIRKYKEEYESGVSNIKISRKKIKDLISKAELYDLYVNQLYTDAEIAEKCSVSPSTINALRKDYGIPTNNDKALRKLPMKLTEETFYFLYIKQDWSLQDMASHYHCNVMAILRLKERYGIEK